MYKLFIIEGKPSDGTYMYSYVCSTVVLAYDEKTAIQYAIDDDKLLGDSSEWVITEQMLDCPGIVDYSYTKDC